MTEANNIADWILSKINTEAGDTISPLKLQKLVYYAQAWHLAIFGPPLFEEEIEAWRHGPVTPSIYHRFKDVSMETPLNVKEIEFKLPVFNDGTEQLLNEIIQVYGEHSAGYLEMLTHSEAPWKNARKGLVFYEKSNNVISKEDMRSFYSQLNERKES